jgi:DNA-binding NtrC family response regulator
LADILIVEDKGSLRAVLRQTLEARGHTVAEAGDAYEARRLLQSARFLVVLTDLRLPAGSGLDVLSAALEADSETPVLVMTAFGTVEEAVKAMKQGAADFLTKPVDTDHLVLLVDRALERRRLHTEYVLLKDEYQRRFGLPRVLGDDPALKEAMLAIQRAAGTDATVLILGESGTGKELMARSLHQLGKRAKGPFVAINCAAIPDTLLESELFGYKRGAFTDARSDRAGLFVEADGGTIFLDEIAELSPALQAKLLRVLQEGEIRPLGAARSQKVDVRVVAATNKELEENLASGAFRQDLFYRLNVIHIHLPALRDRAEDILPLAEHFLVSSAAKAHKDVRAFHESAKKTLLAYGWPGNVRELENVVERAVALVEGPLVRVDDLPPLLSGRERRPVEAPADADQDPLAAALGRGLTLAELERDYIMKVLAAEGGNKTRAAQRLALDRKTLYRKLEEYAAAGGAPGPGGGNGGGGEGEK